LYAGVVLAAWVVPVGRSPWSSAMVSDILIVAFVVVVIGGLGSLRA